MPEKTKQSPPVSRTSDMGTFWEAGSFHTLYTKAVYQPMLELLNLTT
jgi:hypothetical protein